MSPPHGRTRQTVAVRDVPLSDFQFVRCPVYDWPQDPDRVVADEGNAAVLIESIRSNTGIASEPGSGSVPDDGATPEPTPTESPTDAVQPDNVFGQTADETRCSAGNVAG